MSGEDPSTADDPGRPDADADPGADAAGSEVSGAAPGNSRSDTTGNGRKLGRIYGNDGADAPALADGTPPTDDLWREADPAPEDDGIPYDLDVYAGMLDALLERGYAFVGFDGEIEDGEIAVRHDVDISIDRAAEMARVEAALGVSSTYCLLVTNPLYDLLAPENRRHLRTILEHDHDVGLHFDPHYYWDAEPAIDDLEARVVADRTALERVLDGHVGTDSDAGEHGGVVATSIHQPPDWALGASFDAFESTYEPRYFLDVEYVSDSAGKWRSRRPFADGVPAAMQLLVHPGLWGRQDRLLPEILDEHRERCHRRIEEYVDPFGG